MSNLALKIEGIGKQYRIGEEKSDTLRGSVSKLKNIFSPNKETFWALKDITMTVDHGSSVGIIGRNGAGKSTLLKIISRITHPSSGRLEIRGRVSSLLEVGTGFHPELTGSENIYLNGTILGMTRKEIKGKYDEIVEFSGVKKFINTPVKHYSSGMKVRLAFSVAAHLEPEILLIDEVLAVGDSEFQKKCLQKMEDASTSGRTVVFVSHNLAAIRSFCTKTALLDYGELKFYGDTGEAIDQYLNLGSMEEDLAAVERRSGTGALKFTAAEFLSESYQPLGAIQSGHHIRVRLRYSSTRPLKDVVVRLQVVTMEGYILFTCNNYHSGDTFDVPAGEGHFDCRIPDLPLNTGRYVLNLQCLSEREVMDEVEYISPFHVEAGNFYSTGKLPSVKQGVLIKHEWTANE